MADNIGNLAVQITGSTTGLSQALKTGEKDLHAFKGKVDATAKGTSLLGGLGMGAAAGAAGGLAMKGIEGLKSLIEAPIEFVKDFVTDSIKLAGEMEDVALSFKTMTGDAERGSALFKEIRNASEEMRVSVKDGAEAAKTLLAGDVGADQVVPWLRQLGDLAMGDAEKLKGLANTYSMVRDQGQVTSRSLRAFAGQGVFLGDDLAKSLGASRGELKGMMADGKVSFRDLQGAILAATSEGGKFFGATEARGKTFNGLIDRIKHNWEELKVDLGGMLIEELGLKGFAGRLGDAMESGRHNLEEMRPIIHDIANGMREAAAEAFKMARSFVVGMAELADWKKRNQEWLMPRDDLQVPFTAGGVNFGKGGPFSGGSPSGANATSVNKMFDALDRIFNRSTGTGMGGHWRLGEEGAPGFTAHGMDTLGRQLGSAAGSEMAKAMKDAMTLSPQQSALVRGLKDQADPMGAMTKEMADLTNAFNIAGGGILGGGLPWLKTNPAFNQGVANIFNKFAGNLGQTQIAAPALKDSAEALSRIADFEVGRSDAQADVKGFLAAIAEQTKESAKQNRRTADALDKAGVLKVEKLPN